MKIDRRLAGLVLERADGGPVALESLWRDGPVVLVWVRHFG